MQQEFIDFLRKISRYRNGAMHTAPLPFEAATECRKLITSELKLLITFI